MTGAEVRPPNAKLWVLWSSTQALSLELSLLQQREYLYALGSLRVLLVVAGVARRTKSLWDDVSPYSIVSVHVAFHQWLEGNFACLSHHHFTYIRKSSAFFTFSFLFNEAFVPLSNPLHLLPQPGKPPQLMTMNGHHCLFDASLWSYRLSWDCSVFILFWLCWLLFRLVSLFFLNLKYVLFSLLECVFAFACCFLL